jgi:hypothetical protein
VFTLLPEDPILFPNTSSSAWLRLPCESIFLNGVAKTFVKKALLLDLEKTGSSLDSRRGKAAAARTRLHAAMEMLCEECDGDLGHALVNWRWLRLGMSSTHNAVPTSAVPGVRDRFLDVIHAARRVLYVHENLKSVLELPWRVVSSSSASVETLVIQWVFANYIEFCGSLDDVVRITDGFSVGDTFMGQSFQQPVHASIAFGISAGTYMLENRSRVSRGFFALRKPVYVDVYRSRCRNGGPRPSKPFWMDPIQSQQTFYRRVSESDSSPAPVQGITTSVPEEEIEDPEAINIEVGNDSSIVLTEDELGMLFGDDT